MRKNFKYIGLLILISLILRFPLKNTILTDNDQLHNFNQGARLLNTSLFEIHKWYKNTFANLFILSNHGISTYFLSLMNLLLLQLIKLKLTWWSYFIFYILMDIANAVLIYLIFNNFFYRRYSFFYSLLYVFLPVFIYNSVIRPCWLIYSVFFELLFILFFLKFEGSGNKKYFYFNSIVLSFILLGDPNFINMSIVTLIILYFLYFRLKSINKKELYKFLILPTISISINILFSSVALYKGYYLGLFGHFLGHLKFPSFSNTDSISLASFLLNYIEFFYKLLITEGPLLLLNIIFLIFYFRNKNRGDKFSFIFVIWNLLMIISIIFFNKLHAAVGLYFISSILLISIKDRIISNRLLNIFILFILIVELFLSIDMKYGMFNFYSYKENPVANKNFGQLAVGKWVLENTNEADSLLVVTPKTDNSCLFYSSREYLLSCELYFRRIYTYCKGEAPKRLFSLTNVFNGRILYNIKEPPKYVIDFSGDEDNFLKVKQIDRLKEFPLDRYRLAVKIYDNTSGNNVIKIYIKDYEGKVEVADRKEYEKLYMEKYSNVSDFIFSPYQGLWVFIP